MLLKALPRNIVSHTHISEFHGRERIWETPQSGETEAQSGEIACLRLRDRLWAELRLGLAIPTAEYQLMERTVSEAGGTREGIV